MKRLMVLTAIFSVMGFSGCSGHKLWYGETKPQTAYVGLESQYNAKLFVWSPKNNATVINKDGKGCVQGADVFHEQSGSVDISKELLSIIKGITISSSATAEEKALAVTIKNEVLQLKTNTERNTYLSIGMFGLCQLQINSQLSNTELLQLVGQLIETSAKIGNPITVNPTKDTTKSEESNK